MEPSDEQTKERMTAQPRENYDNVDCPDHCCKACRVSSDRSDDADVSTHDGGFSCRAPRPKWQK
eukprot:4545866-Pyramimonas_sp.AAC.1